MNAELRAALEELAEECVEVMSESPVSRERDIAPPPSLAELRDSDLYASVKDVEACYKKSQGCRGLPRASEGYWAWQSVLNACEAYHNETDGRKLSPHARAYYNAITNLQQWCATKIENLERDQLRDLMSELSPLEGRIVKYLGSRRTRKALLADMIGPERPWGDPIERDSQRKAIQRLSLKLLKLNSRLSISIANEIVSLDRPADK